MCWFWIKNVQIKFKLYFFYDYTIYINNARCHQCLRLCGVWEETRLPVANPPSRLGDFMNISQLGCRVSNPGCSSERRAVYLTYNICAPHSSPSLLVGQTGEVHITIGETCTGQDMGRADNDQTYRCRTATGIQR